MMNRWLEQLQTLEASFFIWLGASLLSLIFISQGISQFYYSQKQILAFDSKIATKPIQSISKVDANVVMQAHLFGLAPLSNASSVPISQLNWVVQGISMVFPESKRSRVLLKINQTTKWYKVGDELPNQVELYGINKDHIILKRNGDYETLRLERKTLQFSKPYQRGEKP